MVIRLSGVQFDITVITKSDVSEAGLWFVNQEYDYRQNSTQNPFTIFKIITITKFEKKKPSVRYFGG